MNVEFETMWMEAVVAWSEKLSLCLKIQVLWDVTLCSWINSFRRFQRIGVLSVHGDLFALRTMHYPRRLKSSATPLWETSPAPSCICMKGLGNVRPTSVETVCRLTPELLTSGIRVRLSLLSELLVCHPCGAMSIEFLYNIAVCSRCVRWFENTGILLLISLCFIVVGAISKHLRVLNVGVLVDSSIYLCVGLHQTMSQHIDNRYQSFNNSLRNNGTSSRNKSASPTPYNIWNTKIINNILLHQKEWHMKWRSWLIRGS